ncbi:hypothetical protein CSB20_03015 [bacterium DOLZORAL124_64_63]|nr:MAG: hypothetical protein CSB20_03015 [bacterium DOLZORAL124_64_63]
MKSILTLSLLLALSTAVAGEEIPVANPPEHTTCGAEPSQGVRNFKLVERWSAGGADDEEVLFGHITDITQGSDGHYYVLDARLKDIKVYTPEGHFDRIIGRPGEGPGELSIPYSLTGLADGTIGVSQAFPAKIIALNPDGSPGPVTDLQANEAGFLMLSRLIQRGGPLVAAVMRSNFDQKSGTSYLHPAICTVGENGKLSDPVWSKSIELKLEKGFHMREADVDTPEQRFALGPEGQIALVAPRDETTIHIFNSDADLIRSIHLETGPWQRDGKATSFARHLTKQLARTLGLPGEVQVEKTEPCVAQLHWAADGNLWLQPGEAVYHQEDGLYTWYEVISPEGEWLMTARILLDADPVLDRMVFMPDGRMILIQGFMDAYFSFLGTKRPLSDGSEREPLKLVCYELVELDPDIETD